MSQESIGCGQFVEDDFEFMRSANKLMFAHGTLSWWAGFLGNGSDIACYSKWRGGKNINLAWVPADGWRHWGPATAPQHETKQYHLRTLANKYGLRYFVETGTRGGAMLKALRNEFDMMYSVEIIRAAYEKIQSRLKNVNNAKLFLGDSAVLMPRMIKLLGDNNALFWLDAHDNRNSTPILDELTAILPTKQDHVIVIDDLRYFGTEVAYPSEEKIRNLVLSRQPGAYIDTQFDSIRIFCNGK